MPRTAPKSSPQLVIELDNAQATYFPGDTLNGYAKCDQPPKHSFPSQSVRLKLFGRAKTKYMVKTQNGTSIERGRAVFFEETRLLHQGPISGPQSWPFSITIPETSMPGFAQRPHCDQFRADFPFLHTYDSKRQEVDVTQHPLPSIMYYFSKSGMSGKTVEAYIEYVLVAEGGGAVASYPLYVRQRSVPGPINDYKMQTRTFRQVIKSPRLLPEHADKPLTFSQKSKMLFRPSKTPRYTYMLKVEYPTVIQLEHPEPIPLKIYLEPDFTERKTTISSDGDVTHLPPVKVIKVDLQLKGDINIRCPGMMWDSSTEKNHTFKFDFRGTPMPVTVPVIPSADLNRIQSAPEHLSTPQNGASLTTTQSTPVTHTQMAAQGTQVVHTAAGWRPIHPTTPTGSSVAVDLGSHLSILLGCSASSTLSQPPVSFKRQIYPTFSTYNIFIKYRLEWKIYLSCADEEHEVSGVAPVTILAPSEEQEEQKARELGTQGMKKNYDDLEAGFGQVMQFIGQILQAVG